MSRQFGICSQVVTVGDFIPKFMSDVIDLAPGASGVIVTLTPPAGQKVKIVAFFTTAGNETGLTFKAAGNAVATAVTVGIVTNSAVFRVGGDSVNHPYLLGETDQVITIEKDTGSTVNTLRYFYEFGI